MSKEALIIFVKNPELGKVKTRLAATVGDESALNIYKQLLNYTKQITKDLTQEKWVFYSDRVDNDDIWDNADYNKTVQSGHDLGQKMLNAFKFCFDKGYGKVSIIGSDIMEINQSIIQKAFTTLDEKDIVIGPAKDGGYYLLGMNDLYSSLFHNKKWSTESVFHDTILDIARLELNHIELDILNDIDTESDWKIYINNQ